MGGYDVMERLGYIFATPIPSPSPPPPPNRQSPNISIPNMPHTGILKTLVDSKNT